MGVMLPHDALLYAQNDAPGCLIRCNCTGRHDMTAHESCEAAKLAASANSSGGAGLMSSSPGGSRMPKARAQPTLAAIDQVHLSIYEHTHCWQLWRL